MGSPLSPGVELPGRAVCLEAAPQAPGWSLPEGPPRTSVRSWERQARSYSSSSAPGTALEPTPTCPQPALPHEADGVSRCQPATGAASNTLGPGRASDSLHLLSLIPHGPGQALLPGNQLSQSLGSLSLHLLWHLPVASSQDSLLPTEVKCLQLGSCSLRSPERAVALSAALLPAPPVLPSPLLLLPCFKVSCFSENLDSPNKLTD